MAKTTLKKSDFPESVHGLLDKPKSDLLNIIARKDDVETRLNRENAELKKKIEELNTIVLEQSGCITKANKALEEANTSVELANDEIDKLRSDNYKLHKNFSNCFITLAIVVIILIAVLIYFIKYGS